MKWLCVAFFAGVALAQDTTFTNRVATFTNLQGVVYKGVTLTKADLDGVIYREPAGGGRVCYTNLSPALLEAWGMPTNRIQIAQDRAKRKAVFDAQYNARLLAASQAERERLISQRTNAAAEAQIQAEKDVQQAAYNAIKVLSAQIEAEQARLERLQAIVSDSNMQRNDGGYQFVKETAWQDLADARRRLKALREQYRETYPNGKQP
jgi:uncharacterized protein YjbI with pentapeptide repeats